MIYDFHAHHALPSHDHMTQAYAVDFLTGYTGAPPDKWSELAQVQDPAARLEILAQAMASPYRDRARTGQMRGKPGGLWHWIASGKAHAFLEKRQMPYLRSLGLVPALPDLGFFPAGSWGMHFTFKLTSPYISRDDTAWHILDNPIKKEWLFKLPYVAPSQWKGILRACMVRQLAEWWESLDAEGRDMLSNRKRFVARRIQIARLFGTEKDVQVDDKKCKQYLDKAGGAHQATQATWYRRYVRRYLAASGFFAGRLHFYPTFFTDIGLEVINPHSREKGAGERPIHFECVPAGATGDFVLLYAPFDRIGQDETKTRLQITTDLQMVSEGVRAMLTVYGFGAKTGSGFGVGYIESGGRLAIGYPDEKVFEKKNVQETQYRERTIRDFDSFEELDSVIVEFTKSWT